MDNTEKYPIDEAFLLRYLLQDTDEAENRRVQAWLKENSAHQGILKDLQKIWDTTGDFYKQNTPSVNTESAWQKVKAQLPKEAKVVALDSPKINQQTKTIKPVSASRVWQVAASVAVLIGLGWWIFTRENTPKIAEIEAFASQSKTAEMSLPDGSKVFLNKNSEVKYPKEFAAKERKIEFKGEAFFEVKANLKQPFRIQTDNFEVEVLGTAFNVQTAENTVTVKEGRVKVSRNQQQIILTANEKAGFNPQTQQLEKMQNQNPNYLAYKTKVLVFKETTLAEAVRQINALYQSNVTWTNPTLENCMLTVKFENQDLTTILNIIAETLELKITHQGDKIILSGDCK
jgi:ferric-dicitrate binding protein FerR (iron transport regulator)